MLRHFNVTFHGHLKIVTFLITRWFVLPLPVFCMGVLAKSDYPLLSYYVSVSPFPTFSWIVYEEFISKYWKIFRSFYGTVGSLPTEHVASCSHCLSSFVTLRDPTGAHLFKIYSTTVLWKLSQFCWKAKTVHILNHASQHYHRFLGNIAPIVV